MHRRQIVASTANNPYDNVQFASVGSYDTYCQVPKVTDNLKNAGVEVSSILLTVGCQ